MSQKHATDTESASAEKEQCKSIMLELKLAVLKRIEAGECQNEVYRALNLAGSAVRTILKNKDKIKEYGRIITPLNALKLSRKFEEPVVTIQDNIIGLERKIRFDKLEPEDIQELIDSSREELSNEDLIQIEQQRSHEEEEDVQPARASTSKGMVEAFKHPEAFLSYFDENDPDMQFCSCKRS
ncbi:putative CENPB DNA-binding domain-containing protein 1 [Alligator mississippiensis]|uniref:putative CENPB DNA-binding domain-containing protein 1 n=1 Tax=Alligator mississippiensis TaxID=8496 RepID=UPI00071224A7|nr:putative CENPB DNA-binding domain-containing protein 1 [Alligator mississippiensis]